MSDTSVQAHKLIGASPLAKLARMLRSMSRRWPKTSLIRTTGGFGVRLADGRSLRIRTNGEWTNEDIRDCLVLFATWLVADPAGLRLADIPLDGPSATASARQ
jgi:hypothetical protein